MSITRRTFIGTGASALAVAPALVAEAQAQEKTPATAAKKATPKARGVKARSKGPHVVNLVQKGVAGAIIVTPDEPFLIATYAAQELAHHIKLATGAELAIVTESKAPADDKSRIYVGATKAAQKAGIKTDALPLEHCVLRTQGKNLFIVGKDGPGQPLDLTNMVFNGTLWGVYEVLERTLDARWLWPGEGGIVVKKTDTLGVPAWNETVQPHLICRRINNYVPWTPEGEPVVYDSHWYGQNSGLAYSSFEVQKRVLIDQQVFQRRHRMGLSLWPSTGHQFVGWWNAYGKEHPEWFHLIPTADGEFAGKAQQDRVYAAYGKPESTWKGKRGPDNPEADPYTVSMCVSNTEFHAEIIRGWQEERKKNPGKDIPILIGENDCMALCICDQCRALDPPDAHKSIEEFQQFPGSVPSLHFPFVAGRRYAWFWKRIHQLASKIDPNVRVQAYAYINYLVAPTDIKLHPNIILTFVPWPGFWYPRDPREQGWLRDEWQEWRDLGARMVFRPNYVLDGGSMPLNYVHQQTDQFEFYLQHGCIGTDFDTRVGQWSAQGTSMYALFRKHTLIDTPVEQILEEFYTAFGPAAPHIKAYFDFWESHSLVVQILSPGALARHGGSNLLSYTRGAHELYPDEAFDRAEAILQAAQKVVGTDAAQRARVEYIYNGLRHAKKVGALAEVFENRKSTMEQKRAVLADLVKFRRATETMHIAYYAMSAADEMRSFGDRYDFGTPFKVEEKPFDTVQVR